MIRYSDKNDLNGIIRLWHEAFGDSENEIRFFLDSCYIPHNTVVYESDGEIASMLFQLTFITSNTTALLQKCIIIHGTTLLPVIRKIPSNIPKNSNDRKDIRETCIRAKNILPAAVINNFSTPDRFTSSGGIRKSSTHPLHIISSAKGENKSPVTHNTAIFAIFQAIDTIYIAII
jgi:hypothetical protein